MPHIKYLAYIAIICAVMLDLYSSKPGTTADMHLVLDVTALLFTGAGFGGLAHRTARAPRV